MSKTDEIGIIKKDKARDLKENQTKKEGCSGMVEWLRLRIQM